MMTKVEEEEKEDEGFPPVEKELDLVVDQLEGVGAQTKKKLETFGVSSIVDICVRGSREITEITGVTLSLIHI